MLQGLYGWLVDTLGLDESNLRSPLEWAWGLWVLVKRSTPGSRERRVWLALCRGRVLYAAPDGHLHICRIGLEWENEQQQRFAWFFTPAANADQLEAAVLAYLASIGRQLQEGQFIPCPASLARLAIWGELAEA